MAKNYYDILGVTRQASEEEIRRAFKKLARQYHPDKNPGDKKAEEKFKNISEAYDVLSDPQKKKQYDAFGGSGFEGFPGGGSYHYSYTGNSEGSDDLNDIFGDIFGRGFGFGGQPGTGRKKTYTYSSGFSAPLPQRGRDLFFSIDLDFLDAVRGCEKKIRLSNGVMLTVKIPSGVTNGSKIRLAGKGEPGIEGGEAGDLYIQPRIIPHPYFRREGDDIELPLPLTVTEAIEGCKVSLPTIDGHVDLKIPAHSQSGYKLRLKGRGVLNSRTKIRGDQYVILEVKIPTELDTQTETKIKKILAGKEANPRVGKW